MRVLQQILNGQRILGILRLLDLSGHLSNHMVGKNHTIGHRRFTGVLVMTTGVVIVKAVEIIVGHNLLVMVIGDVIGYGLHGIGLIPFATNLEHKANKDD